MNKQDALTKLAALEAETRALRAIIEAPDKPAVPTRWRPENREHYLYVAANGEIERAKNGEIERAKNDRMNWDTEALSHGNCFKTSEQAAIAAKAVSVTLKVCAAAFAVDPDAGGFFRPARRWTAVETGNKWDVTTMAYTTSYPCYVHTRAQAEQMAAILNAEGGVK